MLLIFDDNNKKSYPIGTKLFIRIRIINISLVFFHPNALPNNGNFKQTEASAIRH